MKKKLVSKNELIEVQILIIAVVVAIAVLQLLLLLLILLPIVYDISYVNEKTGFIVLHHTKPIPFHGICHWKTILDPVRI